MASNGRRLAQRVRDGSLTKRQFAKPGKVEQKARQLGIRRYLRAFYLSFSSIFVLWLLDDLRRQDLLLQPDVDVLH